MDCSRNHLVADINNVPPELRDRYTPVPQSLALEAERELAGKPETYVNPNRVTALTQWAGNRKRKERKRAKLAKASRRRNRK